ncbi:unnamed protein product [Rotaria socialis]|uniref:Uncharacterized protein n=1 Tax=Rotaria socialis TaxID=392032 RepID=A0A818I820_9BILA|nr:unnamed protein product [Rotaria socialis]CAF3337800.1 unnamed protein product [Rotaria socialis]CAF3459140.1 unnamed protein product [Rotaria socialis]CAF3518062.1 unnamed protein product [Rotaria socialis]CAF3581369.1 unnamed protein product [Rotaria socialis]
MESKMCGVRAPGHVYSAVLKNSHDNDVTVEVEYAGSDISHSETATFTVAAGGSQAVEEKTVQTGEHEQRKFIHKLTVKLQDGTTQELSSPFEGVTSPKHDWQFEVDQNGSLKSGSQ